MATSTFDAAAEAKFRNNVAEYNKTAAPEDKHSEADIEQEVNNRRMATAIPGASTIPANTAAEISKGIDTALPATTAVPSPMALLPATATSQPASSAVAGSPFGFDSEEIKKKLLAYGWVPPAAYGAYELGKKALPSAQQLWGNLSQKMTGSPDVPAPQIEPILDAAPTQSNMDKMRATLKMAPRPEVQTVQDIAEKLTPDQIRQQKMDIATKAAQQQMAASAVPGGFAPVNATPAPVTPSVVEAVTPAVDASITANPIATPVEKAQALVHAPENSNVKPFNIVRDSPKVTFGDLVASDEEILKNRQELRNTVSNLQEIRSPDNGKTFYVVDHNGEWGTKAFASEAEAQQELTKIQNKIKNPIPPPEVTPGAAAILETQTPAAETPVKGAAVPRAARGSLIDIANNPPLVEGQPGMREQYNIPKKTTMNPLTGKPFMGSGGINYLTGQLGEAAVPYYEAKYGKVNVPAKQVIADFSTEQAKKGVAPGTKGGSFTTPKYIPDYIKGAATIGGMANAGLNALGVLGLISDFKEAKKTGDWSNFGLNATGQVLANVIPKAALPAQLATYSKALGESPEELRALGKKLQDAQQAYKFGAGRGMQGVPPPAAYNR